MQSLVVQSPAARAPQPAVASAMTGAQRQTEIQRRLASAGFVATSELAADLQVDSSTIRRDLDGMARAGLVQRTHGGALLPTGGGGTGPGPGGGTVPGGEPLDLPYALKEHRNLAEKGAIAARAAALVADGDSLVLDSGSTTYALAQALASREGLTVATNDLRIAHLLAGRGGVRLVVTGGQLLDSVFTLVGPVTVDNLVGLHVDWAFLGADAVDPEVGVTNRNTVEVPIKQAMLGAAARAVLVADSSKFGRRALATVSGLGAFAHIVTDTRLGATAARRYGQALMRVHVDG